MATSSDQVQALKQRIANALDIITDNGGFGGQHHKQWVLDQVVHALGPSDEHYLKWVENFQVGYDGPNTYEWDVGIPP
jgi:hypothetical protein